jgi:hypothetical protein
MLVVREINECATSLEQRYERRTEQPTVISNLSPY